MIAAPAETQYTVAEGIRVCRDCSTPLDTSVARNVRYCARDRQRRRAITFGRQMANVLHAMPQLPGVTAARAHLASALEELGG